MHVSFVFFCCCNEYHSFNFQTNALFICLFLSGTSLTVLSFLRTVIRKLNTVCKIGKSLNYQEILLTTLNLSVSSMYNPYVVF